MGIRASGDRVTIGRWSIKQLLLKAYRLETYQVVGPDWIDSARFDVVAKLPEGGAQAQVPEMLQSLLVERFALKTHRETRELSGYALVVGKGGAKMQPAVLEPGESADPASNTLDDLMGDGRSFGAKMVPSGSNLRMEFTKIPIRALAQIVGSHLREPVYDMTELKGQYQVALEFSAGRQANGADPNEIPMFTAVNRLGLKLERRKAPVSILVVDSVEKVPTAN